MFWAVAFVIRPVYIFATKPSPPNPLADIRLMPSNYESGLVAVARVIAVTQVCYIAVLLIVVWRRQAMQRTSARSGPPGASEMSFQQPVVIFLFFLGWLGRASLLVGLSALATALLPFGTVGAGLLILLRRPKPGQIDRVLLAVLASEAAWSVLFASKTPIIAVLTALAMRWAKHLSPRQMRWRLPAFALLVLLSFLVIQPIKGISTASTVQTYTNTESPLITGPLISVLQGGRPGIRRDRCDDVSGSPVVKRIGVLEATPDRGRSERSVFPPERDFRTIVDTRG